MHDTSRPTIVLLHGAWHGPWCWSRLLFALRADGWDATAPRLRSVPVLATQPFEGLHDDVAALLDHVDHIDGPVVLVAHSYAGMPATAVAALRPDKVVHLVYLAAYVPQAGDNLFDIHGITTPEDVTGTVPVPDDPIAMFYADVDPAAAAAAAARLRPQSLRSWTERVENTDVYPTPTTYLLCTNDQGLPTSMQDIFAARTDQVVRVDSGHSPFLSQPQHLAAHVAHALDHPSRTDVAEATPALA